MVCCQKGYLGAQEERGQEGGEVLAMCAGERVEIIDYEEVFCLRVSSSNVWSYSEEKTHW
jgi:hypothetical protein